MQCYPIPYYPAWFSPAHDQPSIQSIRNTLQEPVPEAPTSYVTHVPNSSVLIKANKLSSLAAGESVYPWIAVYNTGI